MPLGPAPKRLLGTLIKSFLMRSLASSGISYNNRFYKKKKLMKRTIELVENWPVLIFWKIKYSV